MLLQVALFCSFLWLNKIQFYVCVCVCVCVHHIFFIHFSADGHFGCFHVLAIVNSAAMNNGVHVSFWIAVFFQYIPRSGIARYYGKSIFSFLRTLHTVVIVVVPVCISTRNVGGFLFSTSFPVFIVYRFFDDGRSDKC